MSQIQRYSFIFTLSIFALSFVNISFGLLGLICYFSPFYLFMKYKDKTFCKKYCPRASLLQTIFSKIGLHKPIPKWLNNENIKEFMIYYMGANFLFALLSTTMIFLGRIQPMAYLRLFMVIPTSFVFPQLIEFNLPPFLVHYSYRILSMMFSSILLGFVLGFIYAPRTWCVICPVNTLSVPKKLKQ